MELTASNLIVMEQEREKRILVVGANGTLGTRLIEMIRAESRYHIVAVTREYRADKEGYEKWSADVPKDWKEMSDAERWQADVVVNVAAMTDVDGCETDRERAWRSNVELVESIVNYCRRTDARLIQLSTDYVFDGTDGPYAENDRPNPINYYGRTKHAAENTCLNSSVEASIIRTMWLYGAAPTSGKAPFSAWVREELKKSEPTSVVEDEYGNPTLYDDLAYALLKLIDKPGPTILHTVGKERVSRLEWAKTIASVEDAKGKQFKGIPASSLKRKAERPLSSGLITNHPQLTGITGLTGVEEGERRSRVMAER